MKKMVKYLFLVLVFLCNVIKQSNGMDNPSKKRRYNLRRRVPTEIDASRLIDKRLDHQIIVAVKLRAAADVKELLTMRADPNVRIFDIEHRPISIPILMIASQNGDEETIQLLLEAHADVNAQFASGWTALHEASYYRHVDAVLLLLDARAHVNAQTENGWTALHSASYHSCADIVRLLLSRNADINVQDVHGETALMWAFRRPMMTSLLRAGACITVQDNQGMTALDRAIRSRVRWRVCLLLGAFEDIKRLIAEVWQNCPVEIIYCVLSDYLW